MPIAFPAAAPVRFSPLEESFWRAERSVAGSFRVLVVLHLDVLLDTEATRSALRHLQHRHPKTRGLPAADGDRLRWEFGAAAPEIPLAVKDFDEELPWRVEAHVAAELPMTATEPLMKVVLLRSQRQQTSAVILVLHHTLADGMSAMRVANDFLVAYAAVDSRPGAPPRDALPPVGPARVRQPLSWKNRAWLLRRMWRFQRAQRRQPQTPIPQSSDGTPASQWEHWVLSRGETLELFRRCRKEQVTVGAALAAAVLDSLRECLGADEACFKWQFPFDVREELDGSHGPVTPHDVGNFASIMNERSRVGAGIGCWDLARSINADLKAFSSHGGPAFYFSLVDTLTRILSWMSDLSSTGERATVLVTHYGGLSLAPMYGDRVNVRGAALMFPNRVAGPLLVVECIMVGQSLNVSFTGGSIEPTFWNRLHAAVRQRLDDAAARSKTAC